MSDFRFDTDSVAFRTNRRRLVANRYPNPLCLAAFASSLIGAVGPI